jgi:caa(3)-type oxidase subunit IV
MTHAPADASQHGAGTTPKMNVAIWAAMLVIVALEVVVTYQRPGTATLIVALLALAIVQASLGVLYFMHLRYERAVLGWTLVSSLVFVLAMMNQLWPDALRVLHLRLHE